MKKFLPTWSDKNGNRMFFINEGMTFDSAELVRAYQKRAFMTYLVMGLKIEEPFEVELGDDLMVHNIEYREATVTAEGLQMPVAVISGPLFEQGRAHTQLIH